MSQPPFSFEAVEDEVREVIIAQASTLECLGPQSDDLALRFLGIDEATLDAIGQLEVGRGSDPAAKAIDLKRHHLWVLAREAYHYAFQVGDHDEPDSEVHYEITCALPHGYAQTDMHGNPSPLSDWVDGPLKQTFDTFVARWGLSHPEVSSGLTVRDLSLLANMSLAAVRNSLSKEGFKLKSIREAKGKGEEDRSAVLSIEEATVWLSRRRGFVATRNAGQVDADAILAELFADQSVSFAQALQKACAIAGADAAAQAVDRLAPQGWLKALLSGDVVSIEIGAIRALAQLFRQPEASFTALAVRDLIEREQAT